MRFALNLVARILLVLCLMTNVVCAQSEETPEFEEFASSRLVELVNAEANSSQSNSLLKFVLPAAVSVFAVTAAALTNSLIDSVGYLSVAIGADRLREE